MSIREDVEKVQKKVEKIQKQSFAMEMMEFQKEQNSDLRRNGTRLFIMWLITFIVLVCVSIYTIYLLKDISKATDENVIEIDGVEKIDNSHIKIGDDIWEKSE